MDVTDFDCAECGHNTALFPESQQGQSNQEEKRI